MDSPTITTFILFVGIPSWFPFLKNRNLADWLYFIALMMFVVIPGLYVVYFSPTGAFYRIEEDCVEPALWLFLLFSAGYLLGRALILRLPISGITESLSGSVEWLVLGLVAMAFIAKVYLISIGRFFIREDLFMDVDWEISPWIRLFQNAHLLGFVLYAIYYFRSTSEWDPMTQKTAEARKKWIFFSITAFTIGMDLLQARRAGVVLPVLIIGWLVVLFRRKVRLRLLALGLAGASMFAITTMARYSGGDIGFAEDAVQSSNVAGTLAVDALVGRVGNPFIIATHIINHVRTTEHPYNRKTLKRLGQFIVPIGKDSPFAAGNDFGHEIGLLDQNNYLTGLNMGWVGEAYLGWGAPGVLFYGFLFGIIVHWVARKFQFKSDFSLCGKLFLLIFCINGFQMEIAYPIYTLFRAILAIWIVKMLIGDRESAEPRSMIPAI